MPNDWTDEDSLDDDSFLGAHDENGPPDDVCGCEDQHDVDDDDDL